jgi:MFS family permease
LGRSLYGKFGKNIHSILLLGFCGAAICYLVAAVSSVPLVGLLACGLTGFCASMLWPGSLIAATDLIPQSGVVLFAMMAAGGDLGASVGPQLVGVITDAVIASPALQQLALQMGMLPSQFGMKLGLLTGMLFPLVGIPVCLKLRALYKMKGRS